MNKFANCYAAFMRKLAEDDAAVEYTPKRKHPGWHGIGSAFGWSGVGSMAPAASSSAGAQASSAAPVASSADDQPALGSTAGVALMPSATASGAVALPLGTAGSVAATIPSAGGASAIGSAKSSGGDSAAEAVKEGIMSPPQQAEKLLRDAGMIKEHSFHSFGTVFGSFMSKMASFARLGKKANDFVVKAPIPAPRVPVGEPDYMQTRAPKDKEYYFSSTEPGSGPNDGASVGTGGDFGRYMINPTANHNLGAQNSYWRWLDNRHQESLKGQPDVVRRSVVPVRDATVIAVNSKRGPEDQLTPTEIGIQALNGRDDDNIILRNKDVEEIRIPQAAEGAARIWGRGTPAYYDAINRYIKAGESNHAFWKATQGNPARADGQGEQAAEPTYQETTYGTPEQQAADRAQMKGMAYNNRRPRTAVPA